jgi:hypothetical protein
MVGGALTEFGTGTDQQGDALRRVVGRPGRPLQQPMTREFDFLLTAVRRFFRPESPILSVERPD